jgi:hypothetical protein
VLFYEDLTNRPEELMREVFDFIGVDSTFRPDLRERHNASIVKRRWLDHALNRPGRLGRAARRILPLLIRETVHGLLAPHITRRLRLSSRDRAMLVGIYRADILQLQEMTGRDLASWLR